MRPRLIASAPGSEDPALTPYARFERFARLIVSVPKAEADLAGNKTKRSATKRERSPRHETGGTVNSRQGERSEKNVAANDK